MKLNPSNLFIGLFITLRLTACQSRTDVDTIYNALKPGQAKLSIRIDDTDFYPPASVFTGGLMLYNNSFRLNVSDQFESNVIVSFQGENWYKERPIRRKVFADNQVVASVMIGRLTDKINRRGEGYLMTDGEITVETITDEKIVMRLTGKVGKYEFQNVPKKWNTVKGLIVFKKPTPQLQGVTKKDVFF